MGARYRGHMTPRLLFIAQLLLPEPARSDVPAVMHVGSPLWKRMKKTISRLCGFTWTPIPVS
jgi:hypothetical protein